MDSPRTGEAKRCDCGPWPPVHKLDCPQRNTVWDRYRALSEELRQLGWMTSVTAIATGFKGVMVETDHGPRPVVVPGDVVQQWHDELEATARKVGRYLDDIRYGATPSSGTGEKP